jgi:hypothetical protein
MRTAAPSQDYGRHEPPGGQNPTRICRGSGLPFARPRIRQPVESDAFENNTALRQRIDEEISRSLGYRISSASGDDGSVRSAATKLRTCPTAVKSAETTVRMSIKPPDTRRLGSDIRNVASFVRRPQADRLSQLSNDRFVVSAENVIQDSSELRNLVQSVHLLNTAGVRCGDPVFRLSQIKDQNRFERTDTESVMLESVDHVYRIIVGIDLPLEADSQATVMLDLLNDRCICVFAREGRIDDRVLRVVARSQSCQRRQDFDNLAIPREMAALVVETVQDSCEVDHFGNELPQSVADKPAA